MDKVDEPSVNKSFILNDFKSQKNVNKIRLYYAVEMYC